MKVSSEKGRFIFAGKQIRGNHCILILSKNLHHKFLKNSRMCLKYTYDVQCKVSKNNPNTYIVIGYTKVELGIPELKVIKEQDRFISCFMGKSKLFRYCYDMSGTLDAPGFYMRFLSKLSTDTKLKKLYSGADLKKFAKDFKVQIQNLSTFWSQEWIIDTQTELELLRTLNQK